MSEKIKPGNSEGRSDTRINIKRRKGERMLWGAVTVAAALALYELWSRGMVPEIFQNSTRPSSSSDKTPGGESNKTSESESIGRDTVLGPSNEGGSQHPESKDVGAAMKLKETELFFSTNGTYSSLPMFQPQGFSAQNVHTFSEYIISRNERILAKSGREKVLKDNLKVLWVYLQDPQNKADSEFNKCLDDIVAVTNTIGTNSLGITRGIINRKLASDYGPEVRLPTSRNDAIVLLNGIFDPKESPASKKKAKLNSAQRLSNMSSLFTYLGPENARVMQGLLPQFMRGVSKTLQAKLGDKKEFTDDGDKAALEAYRQITEMILEYYAQSSQGSQSK